MLHVADHKIIKTAVENTLPKNSFFWGIIQFQKLNGRTQLP